MALHKLVAVSDTVQSAIWKIEETEAFFSEQMGFIAPQKTELRRLEFLASRFLLKFLIPDIDFSNLKFHPSGKPFLENSEIHLSFSHSFPFVAVSISSQSTGIDIQVFQPKIIRLQQKFLSPEEQELFQNKVEKITLAWTAKEAGFKWFGEGGVDFIRQMKIFEFNMNKQEVNLRMEFLRSNPNKKLSLLGGIEKEFAWSVIKDF